MERKETNNDDLEFLKLLTGGGTPTHRANRRPKGYAHRRRRNKATKHEKTY